MTIPMQYTNQFEQTPVIGQQDLSLLRGSNAMAFQVSANQATPLKAGDRFKLDTAITTVLGFPQIIKAADDEEALGVVSFTNKAVSFAAGAVVEGLVNLGPAIFMVAADTIAPGAVVEKTTDYVQTKNAGAGFAIALDPGVADQFLRVALLPKGL